MTPKRSTSDSIFYPSKSHTTLGLLSPSFNFEFIFNPSASHSSSRSNKSHAWSLQWVMDPTSSTESSIGYHPNPTSSAAASFNHI